MTRKKVTDLAKRRYRWLVRVSNYVERVHREQIETQFNPSNRETCLQGLFLRATLWLLTLKKLTDVSDVQALAACTRSLVEIAVDMLLIHEDKGTATADRMHWWERSAMLQAATRLVEHFRRQNREVPGEYKAQVDLVHRAKAAIEEKRMDFWGSKRHPRKRWTGNDLPRDIKAVDEHHGDFVSRVLGLTLTEYYEAELRWMNWYTHGSTLAGFRDIPDEFIAWWRARSYEVSGHLGMICAHVIQTDYRFFELFPERQTEWESILNECELV